MLTVANPIYDIVFKYLMEDERIAKTLLSALLKKTVVEVNVRRHEYTNGNRDNISMFRIDFAATIEEANGERHLVLIELQKTWLETETLRFRQYLAMHYSNQENIIKEDNPMGYAIPMIAIYILGHRIGNVNVPVIYCNKTVTNYEGEPVTHGLPHPFVESLNHDSIFVQIPLLKGHFNNRLEEVLSIFDQSKKSATNRQVLTIDDDQYKDDVEMMHIVHRLLSAASDAELRQTMNVEDEYYSAIENRDTAIMKRDEKIAEQDRLIDEQNNQIAEQNNQIAEQSNQIAEQSNQIAEQSNQIAEQSNQIAEQNEKLSQKDEQLSLLQKELERLRAMMQQ
ncbi:MAG: hypothetical protein MJZ29_08345 [Bacteroidaceae bacterium]|nr:hypothetical protein [Bacteroidaceae bacterium]